MRRGEFGSIKEMEGGKRRWKVRGEFGSTEETV